MTALRRLPFLRLAFIAALALAFPASAREVPYLTAQELDLVAILPPPVANGSAADAAEQAEVLATQQAASAERVAKAQRDGAETLPVLLDDALGKPIEMRALPALGRLFDRLGATEGAVIAPTKKAFDRRRPYLSNGAIKPLVRPSVSGSYPSGHTTWSTVAAIVLGQMVPEKRDIIFARAADYALSRVVGGMHYLNDLEGGRRAGTAIVVAVMARPEYQADFAAARAELRAYLGLAP